MGAAWVAPYIHPSFRARTRWWLYFFLFAPLRALEFCLPQDVIPYLGQPPPPVHQVGAYRAQEGAVFPEEDTQSGAAGDWNLVVPVGVVVRVHLRLGVGGVVGVERSGVVVVERTRR